MINRAIIKGYVADEPLVRATENGHFASVRIATVEHLTHRKSGQRYQHIEWHSVAFWGDLANRVDKEVRIGAAIEIEGVLRTKEWTAKDGTRHRTTDVVASKLHIIEGGIEGYKLPRQIEERMPQRKQKTNVEQTREFGLPAADPDNLPF